MGGYNQLRIMQKMLYNRYACLRFKEWFVNSGIIAAGSAGMAVKGRHYYRNLRILKESFNNFVQYRVQSTLKERGGLCSDLKELQANPT